MKKVIRCDCNQAGLVIINANTPGGAWLDEIYCVTPDALHARVSRYDYVQRPNGKVLKGSEYTLRMAVNDYEKHAQ